MNKRLLLIILIIGYCQLLFADFPPTLYFKVVIRLKNNAGQINGYIVFDGYQVIDMNRNPNELTVENKGSDSEYLEIIKARKKELKVFDFAGTIPLMINNHIENLAFLTKNEFITIESNSIEELNILEVIIDMNFLLGVNIKSELSSDEFWKYSTLRTEYIINGWDYGDNCGGTIYDYSGNTEINNIAAKMNVLQKEYLSVKEQMSNLERQALRKKWDNLFSTILGASHVLVISSTCND